MRYLISVWFKGVYLCVCESKSLRQIGENKTDSSWLPWRHRTVRACSYRHNSLWRPYKAVTSCFMACSGADWRSAPLWNPESDGANVFSLLRNVSPLVLLPQLTIINCSGNVDVCRTVFIPKNIISLYQRRVWSRAMGQGDEKQCVVLLFEPDWPSSLH